MQASSEQHGAAPHPRRAASPSRAASSPSGSTSDRSPRHANGEASGREARNTKHAAPSPGEHSVQQEHVFTRWDYGIFTVLTLVNTGVVGYFAVRWFTLDAWLVAPLWLLLATVLVFRGLLMHQMRWFSLLLMRRPVPQPPREGWTVGVMTTFVPGAESLEMLEVTLEAMVAMDYPHDTWVLDEGESDEVKALCERLGVHHFTRKDRPEYHTESGIFQTRCKHGNCNAWLYDYGFDHYDVIVGFDPDHIPARDFLMRTLGYLNDPEIGYVQAAQIYYNQKASFIARGAAEETYVYYSATQMAYNGLGHPIVTGCHQVHRTTALKEAGGFAAHDADDLLITLIHRSIGWKGVYVPEVLAKGLTPVDWTGYLKQQQRWARSVLDVKLRVTPALFGKLSLWDRVVALIHGIYYFQGLLASVMTLLLLYMLATGHVPVEIGLRPLVLIGAMTAVLTVTEFYKQRFFLEWRKEWGLHWRGGILNLAKWPFFLIALAEVALGRTREFTLTLKVKGERGGYMLARPHLVLIGGLGAAWATGALLGHDLPLLLHVWAACSILWSVLLIWTETWTYPDPFDRALWTPDFPERPPITPASAATSSEASPITAAESAQAAT